MGCASCGNTALVEIVHVVGAQRLTMHSCTRCEARWWTRDGEPMALGSVLKLASIS